MESERLRDMLENTTDAMMQCRRERDELAFWVEEIAANYAANTLGPATIRAARDSADRIKRRR